MTEYTINEQKTPDEETTVTISETITETRENTTSVSYLKGRRQRKLDQIKQLAKEADELVTDIENIDQNVSEVTVEDIPSRITDSSATAFVIPE